MITQTAADIPLLQPDKHALVFADLAYMQEPGAPVDKVRAAVTAYTFHRLWMMRQAKAIEGFENGIMMEPSLNDWNEYRERLDP